MMRFLHSADWQISRMYSRFDAGDAQELTNAREEGVRRIAKLATEHKVDAVLVAGDVFDSQTPRDKTIERLFDATRGFDGPWLMLPGNHDAALAESVWERAKRLRLVPQNVHLCLQPELVEVTGKSGTKCAVLPAPLVQRHTHTDLTEWFDAAETPDGAIRIGLAHGSVEGLLAEDIDSQNPIAGDRAARARLDYLALGDWHGMKQIDARTWYSGTHEPERFRGNEPGYVLLVEIDAPGSIPRVTPVKCGKYAWKKLALEVQGEADVDSALRDLASIDGSVVADISLTGVCDLASQERLQAAVEAAERRAAASAVRDNDLRILPSEADLQALRGDGFVGAALEQLKDQLHGSEPELARDALLQLARIQRERGPSAASAAQGAAA
ncbi:metallophosphoesterase family protein [Ramlibacter sp. AN1133]|uniref:metallophosphoesterase family protein n=1 Tax=Ramlibacter sp. AN1133 TaxID=3133429 RepID=UPI0030BFEF0E